MFGKMRKFAAVICLGIQITVSILYGFTGVEISKYLCLMIWLVCGMLERVLLNCQSCQVI